MCSKTKPLITIVIFVIFKFYKFLFHDGDVVIIFIKLFSGSNLEFFVNNNWFKPIYFIKKSVSFGLIVI